MSSYPPAKQQTTQILVDSAHKDANSTNEFDFKVTLDTPLKNCTSIQLLDAVLPRLMFEDGEFVYLAIEEVPGQFVVPQHRNSSVGTEHLKRAFTRLPLPPNGHHHRSVSNGSLHHAELKGATLRSLTIKLYRANGDPLTITNLTSGDPDFVNYRIDMTTILQSRDGMSKARVELLWSTVGTDILAENAASIQNRYMLIRDTTDTLSQVFRVLVESCEATTTDGNDTHAIIVWLPTSQLAAVTEGTDAISLSLSGKAISSLQTNFLFAVRSLDHEGNHAFRKYIK